MIEILIGDCIEKMRELPDQSVQCVVTSPPYYGLRDYGVEGQIGLEDTLEEFLEKMVDVFSEVWRVLKDDGTLWVNMGDSYTYSPGKRKTTDKAGSKQKSNSASTGSPSRSIPGLKPKNLIGVPWKLAFALQEQGWILRQDIIWHKPNPMPESVKDRCTKSHEYIFLLSKKQSYYYDHEAIMVAGSPDTHARYARGRSDDHKWADGGPGREQTIAKGFDHLLQNGVHPAEKVPSGWDVSTGEGRHGEIHKNGRNLPDNFKGKKPGRTSGVPGSKDNSASREPGVTPKSAPAGSGIKSNESFNAYLTDVVETRNKRSVWTVPIKGFSEAHFATFPPDLIRPCILAGSRPGDTVLDPFGGSGTTGMVATEQGRHGILIELNPEYAEIAKNRTNVTMGLGI